MNTQRTKKPLARFTLKCFRCMPLALLIVGDISFLGIDFDKAPVTRWNWFTYAFAWICAFLTAALVFAYTCQLLHRLYQWADENE